MPRITVNVYANLREHVGGDASVELDIEPGKTIGDILHQLGIPAEEARIVFLNHRAARLDRVLEGDEQLDLFSAIGGG